MEVIFLAFFLILLVFALYVIACVWDTSREPERMRTKHDKEDEKCSRLAQRDTRIVILSAVRTAMEGLPWTLKNIQRIHHVYPNTRCVFVENDSEDETLEFIQTEFPKVLPTVILQGKISLEASHDTIGKTRGRIARMCGLRNQLLDQIKVSDEIFIMWDADFKTCVEIEPFCRAIDYLIASSDLNGVAPTLFKSLFYCPWRSIYHDTYAFRDATTRDMSQNRKAFLLQTKNWTKQTEPMEVESAFGCLAIYKKRSNLPRYEVHTTSKQVKEDKQTTMSQCEHVAFNQKMGKFQLLPWFRLYV